ncbi:MAG: T9SS type A sorting domain-containing protein [Bacteroidales bacterium]|nr:T9SS type A sorting domain-containing protein [Bacteroidales bacterium]
MTIHSEAPLRLVAIFDTQGHKVLEQKAHRYITTIGIRSLAKGRYIVRTTTDHGISTSKLTVE